MGTRKRTPELIFNLQWRNRLDNGGDKSNVIGMYDTPTINSNFEQFKSYLLKNSGVAEDDVKITYSTDDGQEWVIDSQEWFEIALSAFRLKARLGEVIYLKVDKISSAKRQMVRKHSNDVETQFDMDSMGNSMITPPEWFESYMKQFKRDIVEEVTLAISSNLIGTAKEKESIPLVAISRKIKPESSKRSRKHLVLGENQLDCKELIKNLKFDRKLENKLDKLDAKTKKIKEKKQALINRIEKFENDERRWVGKFSHIDDDDKGKKPLRKEKLQVSFEKTEQGVDDDVKEQETVVNDSSAMNASIANSDDRNFQHMVGGEVYLHTWEVINSGKLPWSPNTELRLTWGSADLVPSVRSVRCSQLEVGEKGTISVCFNIPKTPGTYESYWNFFDKDIRFGTSLSLCVIVEQPLCLTCSQDKNLMEQNKECSKLVVTPNETIGNIKPASKKCNVGEKKKEIGKVIIISENSEDNEPITIPIWNETKKIMYCCNKGGKVKSIEIPRTKDNTDSLECQKNELYKNLLSDVNIEWSKMSSASTIPEKIEMSIPENTKSHRIQNTSHEDKVISQMYKNILHLETADDLGGNPNSTISTKEIGETFITNSVADLSQGIENLNISRSANVDSDSDWESVNELRVSNKYGINEKDLIVDLSQVSKEGSVIEKCDGKTNTKENTDQDNNNNGILDNNNSSRESVSSEASSDLSSGYDILSAPVCEDKEEGNPEFVYVTKYLPKHILSPDFLAKSEGATGPSVAKKEENEDRNDHLQENIPTKEPFSEREEVFTSAKDDVSHCSTACSSFSDVTSGRLFIFPQKHPGFEVVSSTASDTQQNSAPPTREMLTNDSLTYTWAQSNTQYSLGDLQNACAINPCHLKMDPYGPLDQSHPTSQSQHYDHLRTQTTPNLTHPSTFQHAHTTTTHAYDPHHFEKYMLPQEYLFVPNYQQSPPVTTQNSTFSPVSPKKETTASAPPQQTKTTPEETPTAVPVHILPENLVTGAVNVASSAINTARSVINMIVPPKTEPGRWVNGHWITENPQSLRAKNLCILAEMGFCNSDLNATLLARYNDDIYRVLNELIS